jgi:hypothetical protein
MFSDIYASKASETSAESDSQNFAAQPEEEYWPVAWLYRDGNWSNRKRLAKLLTDDHAYLVKNFADCATISPDFFDLQVSGQLIWITYDGNVSTYGRNGRMATWQRPSEWDRGSTTWAANLVRVAEGTLWYAVERNVVPLSLDGDKIVSAATITLPEYTSASQQNIRVTLGGDIWLEAAQPYLFRDGQWVLVPGLGDLTFEDLTGKVWFLPGGGEGTHSAMGYNILSNGKRNRVPLPGNFRKCTVTAVHRDLLLASGGDRIIVLERSPVEPGWRVRNVVGVKGAYVSAAIWIDDHHNLVSQGWSAALPAGILQKDAGIRH